MRREPAERDRPVRESRRSGSLASCPPRGTLNRRHAGSCDVGSFFAFGASFTAFFVSFGGGGDDGIGERDFSAEMDFTGGEGLESSAAAEGWLSGDSEHVAVGGSSVEAATSDLFSIVLGFDAC